MHTVKQSKKDEWIETEVEWRWRTCIKTASIKTGGLFYLLHEDNTQTTEKQPRDQRNRQTQVESSTPRTTPRLQTQRYTDLQRPEIERETQIHSYTSTGRETHNQTLKNE